MAAKTGTVSQACILTGYPVLGNKIEFARGMVANKEDWNKFVMTAKMVSDNDLQVVLDTFANLRLPRLSTSLRFCVCLPDSAISAFL